MRFRLVHDTGKMKIIVISENVLDVCYIAISRRMNQVWTLLRSVVPSGTFGMFLPPDAL